METRKITIANTRDQKKSVVMTAATTLGELKRDLDAAGINYCEMDFIEALTKTQLRGDESVLPHDVPFNHTTTNELVFLLTTPNRKIKSGIDRNEVYDRINNFCESDLLKDAIKNHFGRNYTMVKTSELEDFIDVFDYNFHHENEPQPMSEAASECTIEHRLSILEDNVARLNDAIMNIIDVLDEDYFTEGIYEAIAPDSEVKDNTVYSAGMNSKQIDELIDNI